MTHMMGTGGNTGFEVSYKVRVDATSNVQFEYSTQSDLSISNISIGVTPLLINDWVCGEKITGLTPSTRYYYSILINF